MSSVSFSMAWVISLRVIEAFLHKRVSGLGLHRTRQQQALDQRRQGSTPAAEATAPRAEVQALRAHGGTRRGQDFQGASDTLKRGSNSSVSLTARLKRDRPD